MSAAIQPQLTHGSLFSGIGGFDLAAEQAGWKNMFNCEIEPFCKTILNYHFPDAQQYSDIKTTDFSGWRGKIDILSGGFPCQPFSSAGKRRGTDDNRYLWPHMLRAIQQIQPRWIVGENVLGIVNWNGGLVFEQVCADLEAESYEVQPFVLPACSVNAPHLRYRTFFVAHRADTGTQRVQCERDNGICGFVETAPIDPDINLHIGAERGGNEEANGIPSFDRQANSSTGQPFGADSCDAQRGESDTYAADTNCSGFQTERTEQPATGFTGVCSRTITDTACECGEEWIVGQSNEYCELPRFDRFPTQSPVCGRNDGISDLLDADAVYQGRAKVNRKYPYARWRTESIKGYGNAIVPPLVYRIFCAINIYEEMLWEN